VNLSDRISSASHIRCPSSPTLEIYRQMNELGIVTRSDVVRRFYGNPTKCLAITQDPDLRAIISLRLFKPTKTEPVAAYVPSDSHCLCGMDGKLWMETGFWEICESKNPVRSTLCF
jgi:hypothetical protein